MKLPSEYVFDPAFHQRPLDDRIRDVAQRVPEFSQLPRDRQEKILSNASRMAASPPTPPPPRGGLLQEAGKDLSIGFRSGVSDLARTGANVSHLLGVPSWERNARKFSQETAPKPEEVAGRDSIPSQVLQGVGAAPATIVKYLPAVGRAAPLVAGAIGVVSRMDEGPKEAIKEGLKDVSTFGLMGQAAKAPSRAARAVGSAVASGVTTAAFSGGDVKQTTAASLMGAGFGAVAGKRKPSGMAVEEAKLLLEGGLTAFDKAHDRIRQLVSPQNRPGAMSTATAIRKHSADVIRQSDIAEYALREASKTFEKMDDSSRLNLIRSIEEPDRFPVAPEHKRFVEQMRDLHNGVLKELLDETSVIDPKTGEKIHRVLGGVAEALENPDAALKAYYINYFPHLFKKPEAAREAVIGHYAGKTPLPGPRTFLKQRKYPTIAEALEENPALELVTTDPVEAYLLKWREMKRFTAATRIKKNMAEDGLLEFVPSDQQFGPKGYVKIDDPAFTVRSPRKDGASKVLGNFWAPEPAARVLNNYLTPGLRKYAAVRGIMTFNNLLNQSQLGFSAFHLGFTSMDAVTSKFALGIEKVVDGIRYGRPKRAASGAVDILMSTPVGAPFTVIRNMKTGREMRQEWRKPGSSKNPEIAQLVDLMREAGGVASLDPIYRTNMIHKVKETFRNHEGYLKLVYRIPFAASEKFSKLIMDEFVPMQKLGVFADLARFEMERMPQGYSRQQLRQTMARAWDSVDNRMGMLRYDNLFWEKWIKDMAMMSVRSVGWNLGTWREIFGGALDFGAAAKNIAKGRHWEFTHRMAYDMALVPAVAMMGGLVGYMYTGKAPAELVDWFFPKTGRKDEYGRDERVSIPSYIKDMYHMIEGATDVARGDGGGRLLAMGAAKLHSSLWTVADMLGNRDFYNTEIANRNDPLVKNLLDYTLFLGKQYTPFSWASIAKQHKKNDPVVEQVLTFFGMVPAPSDIKKTRAERLASGLMTERLPRRASTHEEREVQMKRRELERKIRMGEDWKQFAIAELTNHGLSDRDVVSSITKATGIPLDRYFSRMSLPDQVRVYKAATPEERTRLLPVLREKVERSMETFKAMPEDSRQSLANELLEILTPSGGATPPPPGSGR